MKLAWIISPPSKGSGGFRTICSKAAYMEQFGIGSTFFILPGAEADRSAQRVAQEIKDWFGYEVKVELAAAVPSTYEAVIATAWNTAEYASVQECRHKLYFIQDYEPWFYPMGEAYLCAELSYRYGLRPITIGRWLSSKIGHYYDYPVPYCDFGADLSVYRLRDIEREPFSVCAIYQQQKDRRLSGALEQAIELAAHVEPRLKFYLYGGAKGGFSSCPQVHELGVLSIEECACLYAKCSLGISLSASNPSRLPFEMMASGLPVIEIAGENNSCDYPTDTVLFAEPSAAGIASAILWAVREPEALTERSARAFAAMQERSIEHENQMFFDAFRSYAESKPLLPLEQGLICPPDSIAIDQDVKVEYDLLRKDSWRRKAETQSLVYANNVFVSVRFPNDSDCLLRVAIWSKADQADIAWVELSRDENDAFVYSSTTALPSSLCASILHVHLYSYSADGQNPVLLGTVDQLVSSADEAMTQRSNETRSYCFADCRLDLSFSTDFYACDEANFEPNETPVKTRSKSPLSKIRGLLLRH